jgi:hypothetical protein
MAPRPEFDFPAGHPARFDYDPASPDAIEWARVNVHPRGERDFPVDHPKAVDTPGNTNARQIFSGVDPEHPDREAFTGRSPAQARAVAAFNAELARKAVETQQPDPIDAPPPPPPPASVPPSGQPGA